MIKADISLPKELVGTVEAEAEAVYQVLGSSLSALVTNDMSIICNLAVEDEPVHAAYEKFFRTFNRMDTGDFMDDDSNYDDLRRAIMVSRYLDRIAFHRCRLPSDLPVDWSAYERRRYRPH